MRLIETLWRLAMTPRQMTRQPDRGRITFIAARVACLLAVAVVVLTTTGAAAQKQTEIFIPIGMSPGVSGIFSEIGEVVSYDPGTRIVTIRNDTGEHTATVTDDTDVWVDRSASRRPNLAATATEFEAGSRCEIKYVYEGTTRLTEAEWIKIEPGGHPDP